MAGAINIQQGGTFETWLGALMGPEERFYLLAADEQDHEDLLQKAAKIGYETSVQGALVGSPAADVTMPQLDVEQFRRYPGHYTIVDIRSPSEHVYEPLFAHSLHIPPPELRERATEIPAGSSIEAALPGTPVRDWGEAVKTFLAQQPA